MNHRHRRPGLPDKRFLPAAALMLLGTGAAGCLDRPIEPVDVRTTFSITEAIKQSRVEKIDLLLAIDNSRSMADKQKILALAVPDLVESIANPPCVNADGPIPADQQPKSPTEHCPTGSKRVFEPVLDIHIGIVSSSLGSHGGNVCPDLKAADTLCNGGPNATNNDKGHLLSRKDACNPTDTVPTYKDKGFLAWDPAQKQVPKGEAQLGVIDGSVPGLVPELADMVRGAGQVGCGYESQLESIYRFLVDPAPYDKIAKVNNLIQTSGTDQALLEQRAEFLRPDSLLAVLLLTDENDCSIKEYGPFYRASDSPHLPRPRAICATNPNDKCCTTCDANPPAGCEPDPTCTGPDGKVALLPDADDNNNLRCFDQKRRFGVDFLYPTDRYVKAFTSKTIQDNNAEVQNNPLFPDIDPAKGILSTRTPDLVFVGGIVGVPWQDIARDPKDLRKGFKNATELQNDGVWSIILGDPATGAIPTDPLMQESIGARSGENPITGDPIDDSPETPRGNPINGNEWSTKSRDLQYACTFDLPKDAQLECAGDSSCDCGDPSNDNPLCDPQNRTTQTRAKAYPGLRHLEVLHGLDKQGIVASVCPAQVNDPQSSDYGYRPAIGALVDRLKDKLGDPCLPRALDVNEKGQVNCLLIEARTAGDSCSCDPAKARKPVASDHQAAVLEAQRTPLGQTSKWDCFCEVPQLDGDEMLACRGDISDEPQVDGKRIDGFCYVDAATDPPGNAALLASCPETERHVIRLVGAGHPATGATLLMTCSGE